MFGSRKLREENAKLRHQVLLEQERTERITGLYYGLRDALPDLGVHYHAATHSLVNQEGKRHPLPL